MSDCFLTMGCTEVWICHKADARQTQLSISGLLVWIATETNMLASVCQIDVLDVASSAASSAAAQLPGSAKQ